MAQTGEEWNELTGRLKLRERLEAERALRIKYQDLIYIACRLVDGVNGVGILAGGGITINELRDGLGRVATHIVSLRGQLAAAEAEAEFEGKSAQAWCEMCQDAQRYIEAEAQEHQNRYDALQSDTGKEIHGWMVRVKGLEHRLSKWEEWQPEHGSLAYLKAQAGGGSLAARQAYINGLEWHLRRASETLKETKTQARRAALEDAAALVDRCKASYPTSVFPAPSPGQHAETVDRYSAAALRRILPMIAAAIRALASNLRPGKMRLAWCIDETDDGRVLLTAPDGMVALHVDKSRAEMLGRMLLGAVEDEDGYVGQ